MSYAWEQPNSLISESFFRDINTSAFENHHTFDDEIEKYDANRYFTLPTRHPM